MKNMLWIWVMMVTIFASTHPLLAQWVQTNGPYGGEVYSFAILIVAYVKNTVGGAF